MKAKEFEKTSPFHEYVDRYVFAEAYAEHKLKAKDAEIKELKAQLINDGDVCEICQCNKAQTITKHCNTCNDYVIHNY